MFNDIYRNKVVLVTGNTGFKGSWLTVWLLELGAKVIGISRDIPTNPSMFESLGLGEMIEHHTEDVNDLAAIERIVRQTRPDFVFHLAAQAITGRGYSDPLDTLSTNIIGTANVLEALKRTENDCIAVMITSDKCYENVEWTWGYRENDRLGGKDPYSASKAGAETVIYAYYHSFFSRPDSHVRISSTRAGNVIGGGDWAADRIVPDTVRAWSGDKPVVIRNPEATRPWQHVLEPLSGYLLVGERLAANIVPNGESYNFGPAADQVHTVNEVLDAMASKWQFRTSHETFILHAVSRFHEAGLLKLNCDKAHSKLGWKPTLTFEEATAMTAEWYFNYYQARTGGAYDLTKRQLREYSDLARKAGSKWTD